MPRLLDGSAIHGIAGTGVSVDNVLIVPGAGSGAWLTPVQGVCNAPGNLIGQFDPVLKNLTPWALGGADVVCAGACTLAAGLNSTQPYSRLRNAAGFNSYIPNLIPLDVDREFGIALLYNRQQGQNISIFYGDNLDPAKAPVLGTGPLLTARCLEGLIAWNEMVAGTWTAHGFALTTGSHLTIQTRPGHVYQPLVFDAKGRRWILYSDHDGAGWLHPIDDPSTPITFPANCFGLDAEVQDDGAVLVAWCTNQGESAGSLKTQRVTL
jgi:hypothetical protein